MNIWRTMDGQVTVTLTAAEPAQALGVINAAGIQLWQVEWVDALTVRFRCRRRDGIRLKQLPGLRGAEVQLQQPSGLVLAGKGFLGRPVLTLGLVLLCGLTVFLPTRVLFFQVEGNTRLPDRLILETAEGCGIRFGTSRRQVRSEKMKNALLEAMPELKWAGINTTGCTAVISVREREPEEARQTQAAGFGSIAAIRDAYVTEVTVTRGNARCTPGQVVKQGQILISGVTDLGLCLQVTQAQGEVFGETIRQFRALTPLQALVRGEPGEEIRRYSLIFGKKRINFGKGSGISPATCGRMYKEYDVTLPGGFQLPVRLGVETLIPWEILAREVMPEEEAMAAFVRRQVLSDTVAGAIRREQMTLARVDQAVSLTGQFTVHEMIGRVTKEEIGEANGKTD